MARKNIVFLKVAENLLLDTNGKRHFVRGDGEPICGYSVSDEDDNGNLMKPVLSRTIDCERCVEFIKWIKSI